MPAVLKELRFIRETKKGGLCIGTLTTLSEIANSKRVRDCYTHGLAKAASEVASPSASSSRDDWWKPLPKTQMLVLPGRIPLPA